ncbi:MAG: membrane protein insertion efficiency factor YidD [Pseudonocardiales bacterium]|nr:membrane protein insertion efficiency factor YidD [Pseudonocardiales bacterium]
MTVLPARTRRPARPPDRSPRPGPVVQVLVVVLQFYRRWISPAFPPSCRFSPSCSAYAIEALMVHGMLRGSWWTVRRLLRCGPWHPGGMDPVPPARSPSSPAESESSC